jgi:ribosomal protein L11 methyltransferase
MSLGWRVLVTVPAADAELAADRLWSAGALGLEERGDDPVLVLAGFADEATARAAASLESGATVESIDDDSWADEWRAYARPTRIGDVLVQPAWLPLDAEHDAPVVITIEPGRVFGHGGHASTVLALAALWDEPLDGAFVLDVGTGTGVLAIAATRRGAARVVATDIDPDALDVCTANATRNGVGARVRAVQEDVSAFAATFDTVVANLLAVTLRELARDLVRVVVPGGSLVLSGMLDAQVDAVVEEFVDAGCSLRAVHRRDGWAAVVLDRDDPDALPDDLGADWFTDADNPWLRDTD